MIDIDVAGAVVVGMLSGVPLGALGGLVAVRQARQRGVVEGRLAAVTALRAMEAQDAARQAARVADLDAHNRELKGQLKGIFDAKARAARAAAGSADTQVIRVDVDPTRRIVPPARRPDAVGRAPVPAPLAAEETQTWPMGWPAVNGVRLGGPQ